ncbi:MULTISPECIES: pantoate--beta-alanine ligase [Acidithiobacillus]|uniref:Pantoate--beta-alanine ligase n=1 Tax=Acidithiobacillus ferruginosus TaxID=3063951 RepID=A0ACD5IKZ1_9PROT|nr:pantoate--beta-alanine ligase [Acidithiobacillus ferruginosus]MBU2814527.1 pantoate--beta-alanine ligase [Acidithiobacillus ferruginosus]
MAIFKDIAGLRQWRQSLHGTLALVPTMGNLHEGHLALVRLAANRAEHVLVSIYVNPLQFGPQEDFANYPRTLDQDLQRLHEAGCQTVFTPDNGLMYPRGRQDISIVMPPRSLSKVLCGASRPGHFAGVCTVLSKLLHMVAPEILVLGEKDYQQLRIVQQMVADLNLNVQVLPGPLQREADGLAYSSRNTFLNLAERQVAPLLAETLFDLARRSTSDAEVSDLAATGWERLERAGFLPEYLELRDAQTLQSLALPQPGARWFAAARLGQTRLIDNVIIS